MRKNSLFFSTLILLLSTFSWHRIVIAGDLEWSGLYRIEGYQLHNNELRSSEKKRLGYGLHHLVLRPKITASDGITIFGQFDIFNSSDYPNSQMGQVWGSGVRSAGTNSSTSQDSSNTLSHTQKAETIDVTQLYMTVNSEFGQLLVGRAPVHFGLGITHNAGRGLFDHWYDTRDLVGYKFIVGNIYFLPMLGKPSGGTINNSDNLDDFMIQVQYENPENDVEMGVFYEMRKGGDQAADVPVEQGPAPGSVIGGTGARNKFSAPCPDPSKCSTSGVNTKIVNIYALRDTERFRVGMEASFMSGESGAVTAAASGGDKVEWGGFAIVGEMEYRPEASRWKWGLKAGSASGDDPATAAKFEGYTLNRNYDVGMLLFNHPLGQNDFLRTRLVTGSVYQAGSSNINKADVESISNVIYVAPVGKYAFSDRWSLDNSIVTGWLSTNPISGSTGGKSLGYEWDASLNYTPRKGIAWINQVAMLFPGSAWTSGGTYTNNFTYGFATKAAISF